VNTKVVNNEGDIAFRGPLSPVVVNFDGNKKLEAKIKRESNNVPKILL